MSASMMPTLLPVRASASARFTATVVLPTPPLPAPTAMTFFTPGIGALLTSGDTAARTWAVIVMSTSVTPAIAITAARACSFICSLTGHAGVVSSIVNDDAAAVDAHVLDEAELDDVLVEIGIFDCGERLKNVCVFECHMLSAYPKTVTRTCRDRRDRELGLPQLVSQG